MRTFQVVQFRTGKFSLPELVYPASGSGCLELAITATTLSLPQGLVALGSELWAWNYGGASRFVALFKTHSTNISHTSIQFINC